MSRNSYKKSFQLHKSFLLEETSSPGIIRWSIFLSCILLASFIYWSYVTGVDEVTIAKGSIIPVGKQQKVQHITGGVVKKIYIEEGQEVKKGQTLLQLYVPIQRGGIEYFQNEYIKAPASGIVHKFSVNTIGEIIPSGLTILEIVPKSNQLIAEVEIHPQDIGHIEIGLGVTLKYTSYDFSRYGGMAGTLTAISATTFTGQGKEPYYKGSITLENQYFGKQNQQLPILPGMTVTAEIITGQKTVFEYLLKPIFTSANEAMRER